MIVSVLVLVSFGPGTFDVTVTVTAWHVGFPYPAIENRGSSVVISVVTEGLGGVWLVWTVELPWAATTPATTRKYGMPRILKASDSCSWSSECTSLSLRLMIRHAREPPCKVVKDLHLQGALALGEIGPVHSRSEYRVAQLRTCHGGDDVT